jgi:AcrR family transcriptional regulator
MGYAEASAEAISREAGMSKATFYEHFANKEECIIALFDAAATAVQTALEESTGIDVLPPESTPEERVRLGARAFFAALEAYPDQARTLLVEIIGAGPRAMERRDEILQGFADLIDRQNAAAADRLGAQRFASPDDAYAIVGAVVELASRQLRRGNPPELRDLEPVIERVVVGLANQGAAGAGRS